MTIIVDRVKPEFKSYELWDQEYRDTIFEMYYHPVQSLDLVVSI